MDTDNDEQNFSACSNVNDIDMLHQDQNQNLNPNPNLNQNDLNQSQDGQNQSHCGLHQNCASMNQKGNGLSQRDKDRNPNGQTAVPVSVKGCGSEMDLVGLTDSNMASFGQLLLQHITDTRNCAATLKTDEEGKRPHQEVVRTSASTRKENPVFPESVTNSERKVERESGAEQRTAEGRTVQITEEKGSQQSVDSGSSEAGFVRRFKRHRELKSTRSASLTIDDKVIGAHVAEEKRMHGKLKHSVSASFADKVREQIQKGNRRDPRPDVNEGQTSSSMALFQNKSVAAVAYPRRASANDGDLWKSRANKSHSASLANNYPLFAIQEGKFALRRSNSYSGVSDQCEPLNDGPDGRTKSAWRRKSSTLKRHLLRIFDVATDRRDQVSLVG